MSFGMKGTNNLNEPNRQRSTVTKRSDNSYQTRYGQTGVNLSTPDSRNRRSGRLSEAPSEQKLKQSVPRKKPPSRWKYSWIWGVVGLVAGAAIFNGGGVDGKLVKTMATVPSLTASTSFSAIEPTIKPTVLLITQNVITSAPTGYAASTPTKATATPSPAKAEVIKQGMKGDAVKNLQERLILLGYLASGKADGDFGGGTLSAVKAFQKANGLAVDGVVGTTTLAALNSEDAIASASSKSNETEKEIMVWIPKSGKKYHDSSSCSNMKDPKKVTLEEAVSMGYEPCKKCDPPR